MVNGTGEDGRVLKDDVLAYLKNFTKEEIEIHTNAVLEKLKADQLEKIEELTRDKNVVPIKGIRKIMYKTMSDSLSIPHFHFMEEYNVDELIKVRSSLKQLSQSKLSFMPFFIKALSLSLDEFPIMASKIDHQEQMLHMSKSHNIGIAMDTPQGLLVPVVKNVDKMGLFDIADELNRLQVLGQEGKLGKQDLSENNMTLSNIGTIGGIYATPIIPSSTVAIGAIGKCNQYQDLMKINKLWKQVWSISVGLQIIEL